MAIKDFFKKYLSIGKVFTSKNPTYLIFYVTAVCNSKCKMCFNWKFNKNKVLKEELTLKEIEKFAKKVGKLEYVSLGGGEPFLRKDLPEICKIFNKNTGAEIFSLPTNCLTPKLIATKSEQMAKSLPDCIFRISMSIDGIGELHDYIRGVKGNFKKVKQTYNLLNKLRKKYPNIEILANTTFCSYNQNKTKQIHDWIRKNFDLDMYGLTLVRGNSREMIAKKIDLEKYKQTTKIFEKSYFKNKGEKRHPLQRLLTILPILTRREVIKTAKSKTRTYNCRAIKKFIVIDSFGNVLPCEMLSNKLGNIKDFDYDLNKLLNTKENRQLAEKIKDKNFCNCTWECAIQNSLVFNFKKYPAMIYEAFFK